MFFSISIPIYNSQQYLDECVSSIMSQTEKDFELILVDDGSSDNSVEICKKWQKEYPNTIRVVEKENEGSLITRRRCISESQGEYLYIIDADDYLLENDVLEKVRREIDKNNVDLVFFGYKDKNCKSDFHRYNFSNKRIFENEDLLELYKLILDGSSFNSLWNKVFSRNLVDWDTDYSQFLQVRVGTDIFQVIPILSNAKSAIYIDEPFYFYRTTAGSIVHTFNPFIFESQKARNKQLKKYASNWGISNLEELLSKILIENACSSVYKIRLLEKEDWNKKIDFVRAICNDYELREAFSSFNVLDIENKKKVISLLLYLRLPRLLVLLIGLIPNKM